MKVKDRHELYNKFNDIMNSVYVSRKDEKKQNFNQNMIKTYMIEGHINDSNNPTHDDFLKFFRQNFENNYEIEVEETEDEFLFKLIFNEVEFFLDAEIDKRFFMLHSSEKTELTDKEISHLLKFTPNFDNIWLTKKMMQLTNKYTTWRGVSINHDEINSMSGENELDSFNLKLNSSESNVKELISMLSDNERFSHSTGIFRLSLLSQKKDVSTRILDDLRYDGKFSVRGKSFNRHLWLINKIYREYKELIHNIEQNYVIDFKNNKFKGLPINIEFSRSDLTSEYIIKTIFSHKKPFKLWGYPKKVNKGYYKVLALDLHNGNQGNKINFEITKDFISIYLPKGNCGNTIARLVCNIQQYLDSQINVWGGENDGIF